MANIDKKLKINIYIYTNVKNKFYAKQPADGFPAGQIGDVDEGIVEGRKDMRHSEHKLTLTDLNKIERALKMPTLKLNPG